MKNDALEYIKVNRKNPNLVVAINRKLTFTYIALFIIWISTIVFMVGAHVSWFDQPHYTKLIVITLRWLAALGICLTFYLSLVIVPRKVRLFSGVCVVALTLFETIHALREGMMVIRNM